MELKKTVVQGAGEALGSAFNFNRTVTSLNLAGNLLGMELGKMGHHRRQLLLRRCKRPLSDTPLLSQACRCRIRCAATRP